MKINGKEICIRCKRKYDLNVVLRPVSIKYWTENGLKVKNYKYVCTCGCCFERTETI